MKYSFLLFSLCFATFFSSLSAQESLQRKAITPSRATCSPQIDGKLLEECWLDAPVLHKGTFYMTEPFALQPSQQETRIRVLYTDFAVYVAAELLDDPDSVAQEFGLRDSGQDPNVDVFAFALDTYAKGLNASFFMVSAAGVQTDFLVTPDGFDYAWDAVWNSAVSFTDEGWLVEMEIPYSALRFSREEVQNWGMNFMREVQRNGQVSFWSPVDPAVQGLPNQFGRIENLKGIEPPLRLTLLPYVSAYYDINEEGEGDFRMNGGMDLKLGLSKNFTLDMSLIPDFGQVLSDNVILNLTPFEVRFDENRPFFTEGTELYNAANIFYSRRVGQSTQTLLESPTENEYLETMPREAPLLNATKISGRTGKGLGVGFFNAMTDRTYARVRHKETGETRELLVDPFTNFNILVVDQNLKNNSNVSFINTNVLRAGGGRDANVTGTEFLFNDKKMRYRIRGEAAVSQVFEKNEKEEMENTVGHKYFLAFEKISGTWQFQVSRNLESDTFDPNDFGFLRAPNEVTHYGEVSYNLFTAKGIFNTMRITTSARHEQLYEPRRLVSWDVRTSTWMRFKNFYELELQAEVQPEDGFDYFDPRAEGYRFKRRPDFMTSMWGATDPRKQLRISAYAGTWRRWVWNQQDYWTGGNVRYRFSDRLSLNHNLEYTHVQEERGYATQLFSETGELESVIFGKRDRRTTTNTLSGSYSFNEFMGMTLRLRHYWSKVFYNKFYDLHPDGDLFPTDYTGINDDGTARHDQNFNAFSIDLVYRWQVAPGSFLDVVWKNNIYTSDPDVTPSFFDNLGNTLRAPQLNSFSVKFIYFLDYGLIMHKLGK